MKLYTLHHTAFPGNAVYGVLDDRVWGGVHGSYQRAIAFLHTSFQQFTMACGYC